MIPFLKNLRAEFLKTKRTSAFWIAFLGAGFIPFILLIAMLAKSKNFMAQMNNPEIGNAWTSFMNNNWQVTAAFLMPMVVICCSSLIAQIEVKNNAWKQVFATPISVTNIFFSKFLVVLCMVALYFILFIIFCSLTPLIANTFFKGYPFFKTSYDILYQIKYATHFFILLLPIMALQFWLSMRFKNFMASIGLGIILLIGSITAVGMGWDKAYLLPYSHTMQIQLFSRLNSGVNNVDKRNTIYIASAVYSVLFTLAGYIDTLFKKER